jgi:hypothetical protein
VQVALAGSSDYFVFLNLFFVPGNPAQPPLLALNKSPFMG